MSLVQRESLHRPASGWPHPAQAATRRGGRCRAHLRQPPRRPLQLLDERAHLHQHAAAGFTQLGTQRELVLPREARHGPLEVHRHVQRCLVNGQMFVAGHDPCPKKLRGWGLPPSNPREGLEAPEAPKPQAGRLLRATTVAPSASSTSASVCGSGTEAATSPRRTATAYFAKILLK